MKQTEVGSPRPVSEVVMLQGPCPGSLSEMASSRAGAAEAALWAQDAGDRIRSLTVSGRFKPACQSPGSGDGTLLGFLRAILRSPLATSGTFAPVLQAPRILLRLQGGHGPRSPGVCHCLPGARSLAQNPPPPPLLPAQGSGPRLLGCFVHPPCPLRGGLPCPPQMC